jgi:ornithine cyclodeaminase
MDMLTLISEADAKALVSLEDAITAIEQVMADHDAGEAMVFPVAVGHGTRDENFFAIKSGLVKPGGLLGCKIGTYWPANRASGQAAHSSTVVLLDDATGSLRAVVSASYLTSLRTAAADAVAIKYLARKDTRVLGVIGTGHQAFYDAKAAALVRPFESVRVWSRTEGAARSFADRLQAEGLPAMPADLDSVGAADVILTVTPAKDAILQRRHVRPGTHISAMGADAAGKQELDPRIARDALCVADVVAQSITIGELEAAHAQGFIVKDDIRTLGGVVRGMVSGRTTDEEITLFDSSGIALQDLVMAELAIQRAQGGDRSKVGW